MIDIFYRFVLTLMLGGLAFGCSTGAVKSPLVMSSLGPDPQGQSVEDQWSEPVNGVRMKMLHVLSTSGNKPRITLLIFAHNVSDQPVSWYGVKPEFRVVHEPTQHIEKSDANLRIFAEPVGGLIQILVAPQAVSKQAELIEQPLLMPGQVVVDAIDCTADRVSRLAVMEVADNQTIHARSIGWAGIGDLHGVGYWRVRAVYKPGGFNRDTDPVKDDEWLGKQIELPETLIYIGSELYGEPMEIRPPRPDF